MAEMTILYHERKEHYAVNRPGRQPVTDYVEVTCREWVHRDTVDVVLERSVLKDETLVYDERAVLARRKTSAQYQRAAIECFDELVENHPNLEAD